MLLYSVLCIMQCGLRIMFWVQCIVFFGEVIVDEEVFMFLKIRDLMKSLGRGIIGLRCLRGLIWILRRGSFVCFKNGVGEVYFVEYYWELILLMDLLLLMGRRLWR